MAYPLRSPLKICDMYVNVFLNVMFYIPACGAPSYIYDVHSKVQGLVIGFSKKLSLDSRGKKDLDCSRVRVHHKPTRKTNPHSECH